MNINLKQILIGTILTISFTAMADNATTLRRQYDVTPIGDLGGGNTVPMGINNQRVVVGYSHIADSTAHAFMYREGQMIDLQSAIAGNLGNGASEAIDINEQGDIAGTLSLGAGRLSYLLTANGQVNYQPLDEHTWGASVNEQGQMVGYSDYEAFVYDSKDGSISYPFDDYRRLTGKTVRANRINESGTIAGFCGQRACFYRNQHVTDLGELLDLKGGSEVIALTRVPLLTDADNSDMRDDTVYVGWQQPAQFADTQMFIYGEKLSNKPLIFSVFGGNILPLNANRTGVIVGWTRKYADIGVNSSHGFFVDLADYKSDEEMPLQVQNINDYVSENNPWYIISCEAVNDFGVIVAQGHLKADPSKRAALLLEPKWNK